MLGIVNTVNFFPDKRQLSCTLSEAPNDMDNSPSSRLYSICAVRGRLSEYDLKCIEEGERNYGPRVETVVDEENMTITFRTQWTALAEDNVPTSPEIKRFIDKELIFFSVFEAKIMDDKGLAFIESLNRSPSNGHFKIEMPIDQAVTESEIQNFINTPELTTRLTITLLVESDRTKGSVHAFLKGLQPFDEFNFAVKEEEADEYKPTRIIDRDLLKYLLEKSKHRHISIKNLLVLSNFKEFQSFTFVLDLSKGAREWRSIEANVTFDVLKEAGSPFISVSETGGKLEFEAAEAHLLGRFKLTDKQLDYFIFKSGYDTIGFFFGTAVYGDGRPTYKERFTFRVESRIPQYWAWHEQMREMKEQE